ncbi:hypothetical protein [Stenotrophomonas terrae]|uniref:hypothetical protein n=1 Tax=Stenotrophomonas terrae TaxID=405446 RepID=UPI00128F1D59|nr:hypothetical protein [Stenotrophomonas terrae]
MLLGLVGAVLISTRLRPTHQQQLRIGTLFVLQRRYRLLHRTIATIKASTHCGGRYQGFIATLGDGFQQPAFRFWRRLQLAGLQVERKRSQSCSGVQIQRFACGCKLARLFHPRLILCLHLDQQLFGSRAILVFHSGLCACT